MKKLAFILGLLSLLVMGCGGLTGPGDTLNQGIGGALKYIHDDEHSVGCWLVWGTQGNGSISCLPDAQYKK